MTMTMSMASMCVWIVACLSIAVISVQAKPFRFQAVSAKLSTDAAPSPSPSSGDDTTERMCLMGSKLQPTPEPGLSLCAEYAASSCCTTDEDAVLKEKYDTVWKSLTGHCPGCLENQRKLLCSMTCNPRMGKFIEAKETQPPHQKLKKGVLRLCPQFCSGWWNSCVNTTLANDYHNHANSFCKAMLDADDGVSVQLTADNCFFTEGPNLCDGSIKDVKPAAKSSHMWFIVTVLVLGVLAIVLIAMVVMKSTSADDDDDMDELDGEEGEDSKSLLRGEANGARNRDGYNGPDDISSADDG